jgi:hypothetical protein
MARSSARTVVAAALAVGALWLQAPRGGAAAAITVSPATAAAGASVTVSGNVPATGTASCSAGAAAQLTSTAALFPPDGFGPQAPRDAAGDFRVDYTIPTGTAPGSYNIGIRCAGGNVGVSATLQVTRSSATTTPPTTSRATTTAAPTTAAPASTVPTTTAPPATTAKGDDDSDGIPWILAVILGVVAVAAAFALGLRRGRRRPSA